MHFLLSQERDVLERFHSLFNREPCLFHRLLTAAKMMMPSLEALMYPRTENALTTTVITPAHIGAAIRWLCDVSSRDKWSLSINEQARLLGVTKHTYKYWKQKALLGQEVDVPRDSQDRLSYLLGIMKGLKALVPVEYPELAYDWFNTPNKNPVFQTKSIRNYLLENGSMISLFNTRNYLKAAQGVS